MNNLCGRTWLKFPGEGPATASIRAVFAGTELPTCVGASIHDLRDRVNVDFVSVYRERKETKLIEKSLPFGNLIGRREGNVSGNVSS